MLKDEKLKLSHPTLTKPIGSYKKAEMAKNDQMISPREKLKLKVMKQQEQWNALRQQMP